VYALICESLADSIDPVVYKSKFLNSFVEFSRDKSKSFNALDYRRLLLTVGAI